MSNENKDETPAASAADRPKRPPPTIDLEASEVNDDTNTAHDADGARETERASETGPSPGRATAWFAAPLSGAVAALLVFAALWAGGLVGEPQPVPQPAVSPARLDKVAADLDEVAARLARVETDAARPAADPALTGRTEALEASSAALREEVARLSAQLRAVASALDEVKATPRDGALDTAALNERLTQLEQATRALSAELARPGAAAEDAAVRRLVVANTLEAAVRRGEPFATALAAAKQAAADPAMLAPLDPFAAKGIAPEAAYLREIVPVLQRMAATDAGKSKGAGPPVAEKSGTGVLDRLQSGLARLVRIEREDTAPAARDDLPSPAALATAVRREDLAAARQDVARLPQASDPQIQAWIKSVDARDAALSASQRFSAEALAAFGKSGQ